MPDKTLMPYKSGDYGGTLNASTLPGGLTDTNAMLGYPGPDMAAEGTAGDSIDPSTGNYVDPSKGITV